MSSLPSTRDLLKNLKAVDKNQAHFKFSRFTRFVEKTSLLVFCVGALSLYICVGVVVAEWLQKESLRTIVLFVYDVLLVTFIIWCGTTATEGLWKVWKVARRFTAIQADLIDSDEAAAREFQAYIYSASADDVEERKARVEQHLKDAKARGAFAGAVVAALTSLGGVSDFISTPAKENPFPLSLIAGALGLGIAVSLLFWLYAEVEFGRLAFELDRAAIAKRRNMALAANAAPSTAKTAVASSVPAVAPAPATKLERPSETAPMPAAISRQSTAGSRSVTPGLATTPSAGKGKKEKRRSR